MADEVMLKINATYGAPYAAVYEVRIYETEEGETAEM